MNDKEMIKYLEAKLMDYATKLGKVQGTLAIVIDLDKPLWINEKLKALQEEIKD